ncbi:MAG TPA: hypothetical protein VKR32_07780, partial [Puia sp.]|nr:hypothetical protein [Puia sp.]
LDYNIVSGVVRIITAGIKSSLAEESTSLNRPANIPSGLVGWYKNDSAIIIQARYDLWKVDPEGNESPINLCHGIGLKTTTWLRWMNFTQEPRLF